MPVTGAISIASNVLADTVTLNLTRNQSALERSSLRLSTGLRIVSPADDPSGLTLSSTLQAQVNGFDHAAQNVQDATNVATVAAAALQTTTSILQRIRSLAVQGASTALSTTDRAGLQAEIDQLLVEIDRVADSTTFNGLTLLDGSFAGSVATQNATATITANAVLASAGSAAAGGLPAPPAIADADLSGLVAGADDATDFPSGQTLGPWQNAGPGIVQVYNGDFLGYPTPPSASGDAAVLTATGVGGVTLLQTVEGFESADSYTLTFDAAYVSGAPTALDVLVDGTSVASTGTLANGYAQYSVTLSPGSGSHTIAFANTTAGSSAALTDVSLVRSGVFGQLITSAGADGPNFQSSTTGIQGVGSGTGTQTGTINVQVVNTGSSIAAQETLVDSSGNSYAASALIAPNSTTTLLDNVQLVTGAFTTADVGSTSTISVVGQQPAALSGPTGSTVTTASGVGAEFQDPSSGVQGVGAGTGTQTGTIQVQVVNTGSPLVATISTTANYGTTANGIQGVGSGQGTAPGTLTLAVTSATTATLTFTDANGNTYAPVTVGAGATATLDNVNVTTGSFTAADVGQTSTITVPAVPSTTDTYAAGAPLASVGANLPAFNTTFGGVQGYGGTGTQSGTITATVLDEGPLITNVATTANFATTATGIQGVGSGTGTEPGTFTLDVTSATSATLTFTDASGNVYAPVTVGENATVTYDNVAITTGSFATALVGETSTVTVPAITSTTDTYTTGAPLASVTASVPAFNTTFGGVQGYGGTGTQSGTIAATVLDEGPLITNVATTANFATTAGGIQGVGSGTGTEPGTFTLEVTSPTSATLTFTDASGNVYAPVTVGENATVTYDNVAITTGSFATAFVGETSTVTVSAIPSTTDAFTAGTPVASVSANVPAFNTTFGGVQGFDGGTGTQSGTIAATVLDEGPLVASVTTTANYGTTANGIQGVGTGTGTETGTLTLDVTSATSATLTFTDTSGNVYAPVTVAPNATATLDNVVVTAGNFSALDVGQTASIAVATVAAASDAFTVGTPLASVATNLPAFNTTFGGIQGVDGGTGTQSGTLAATVVDEGPFITSVTTNADYATTANGIQGVGSGTGTEPGTFTLDVTSATTATLTFTDASGNVYAPVTVGDNSTVTFDNVNVTTGNFATAFVGETATITVPSIPSTSDTFTAATPLVSVTPSIPAFNTTFGGVQGFAGGTGTQSGTIAATVVADGNLITSVAAAGTFGTTANGIQGVGSGTGTEPGTLTLDVTSGTTATLTFTDTSGNVYAPVTVAPNATVELDNVDVTTGAFDAADVGDTSTVTVPTIPATTDSFTAGTPLASVSTNLPAFNTTFGGVQGFGGTGTESGTLTATVVTEGPLVTGVTPTANFSTTFGGIQGVNGGTGTQAGTLTLDVTSATTASLTFTDASGHVYAPVTVGANATATLDNVNVTTGDFSALDIGDTATIDVTAQAAAIDSVSGTVVSSAVAANTSFQTTFGGIQGVNGGTGTQSGVITVTSSGLGTASVTFTDASGHVYGPVTNILGGTSTVFDNVSITIPAANLLLNAGATSNIVVTAVTPVSVSEASDPTLASTKVTFTDASGNAYAPVYVAANSSTELDNVTLDTSNFTAAQAGDTNTVTVTAGSPGTPAISGNTALAQTELTFTDASGNVDSPPVYVAAGGSATVDNLTLTTAGVTGAEVDDSDDVTVTTGTPAAPTTSNDGSNALTEVTFTDASGNSYAPPVYLGQNASTELDNVTLTTGTFTAAQAGDTNDVAVTTSAFAAPVTSNAELAATQVSFTDASGNSYAPPVLLGPNSSTEIDNLTLTTNAFTAAEAGDTNDITVTTGSPGGPVTSSNSANALAELTFTDASGNSYAPPVYLGANASTELDNLILTTSAFTAAEAGDVNDVTVDTGIPGTPVTSNDPDNAVTELTFTDASGNSYAPPLYLGANSSTELDNLTLTTDGFTAAQAGDTNVVTVATGTLGTPTISSNAGLTAARVTFTDSGGTTTTSPGYLTPGETATPFDNVSLTTGTFTAADVGNTSTIAVSQEVPASGPTIVSNPNLNGIVLYDGDFSGLAAGAGDATDFDPGTSFSPWQNGTSGIAEVYNGSYLGDPVPPNAAQDAVALEPLGASSSSSVSQTLEFSAGATYALSFDAVALSAASTSLNVLVDGIVVGTTGTLGSSYGTYTVDVTPGAGAHTITLANPDGGTAAAFTNLSLTTISSWGSNTDAGLLIASAVAANSNFQTTFGGVYGVGSGTGTVDGTIEVQVVDTQSGIAAQETFVDSATGAITAGPLVSAGSRFNVFDNVAITIGNLTSADVGLTGYIKVAQATLGQTSANAGLVVQTAADEGSVVAITIAALSADALRVSNLDLSSALTAEDAIGQVDLALATVLGEAAQLGAVIARLGQDTDEDEVAAVNLQASVSAVRDADEPAETTAYRRAQVLASVGTSVLAQANSQPASVLALFQT